MEKGQRSAFACAKELIRKLPENKRRTYRQRLTSTLILKDYTGLGKAPDKKALGSEKAK